LLWVYYSAQIFLLGAEFMKIFAEHHGNKQEWNRHECHFFDRYRSS
jgi:uncharacterized BrkB/YihY/UPF0761 family membrane protein